MSKTNKEFKLNIEQLNFKPIDWSVYQDQVNQVEIHVDENAGTNFAVPNFQINISDDDILRFQSQPKAEININIDSDTIANENAPYIANYKEMVESQSLTNMDSRAFQKRQASLESVKNWTKISIDDDDSFKL